MVDRDLPEGVKAHIGLALITPDDDGYDTARAVWNGAVRNTPAAIVRPKSAAEVVCALGAADRYNLPIAVHGGGCDWAGRSMRTGSLVIDLSRMCEARIDPTGRLAHLGGGAISRHLMQQAELHRLAAVTGVAGDVGATAFALGGGYGPLTPGFGLGADNIAAAEVVLADGRVVRADAGNEPDLYWALRGGGGNFGIVTGLTTHLHPARMVRSGRMIYAWSEASHLLVRFSQQMRSSPPGLAATMALVASPQGQPVVALAPCLSSDRREDDDALTSLMNMGEPIGGGLAAMAPLELFSLFEGSAVRGRRYAQQTRWLAEIGPEASEALVRGAEERTSPLSVIAIQSFHGVPTRISPAGTAFPLRQSHFLVSIVASWDMKDAADDDTHASWAREVSRSLEPFALPGGYTNLLGPDERTQLRYAYGSNTARLQAIKRRLDPEGRFSAAGPIEATYELSGPDNV